MIVSAATATAQAYTYAFSMISRIKYSHTQKKGILSTLT